MAYGPVGSFLAGSADAKDLQMENLVLTDNGVHKRRRFWVWMEKKGQRMMMLDFTDAGMISSRTGGSESTSPSCCR